uniref:Protein FAM216A n=1 Tax=Sander lucioperca TaxID=283035 RepID=A0A8C9YI28_SANLU
MYRGTHANVSAGGQHMKTIHIPKSMMSAPFLQHPALTAGQRRYLCSIANVYSTEHMRQQMKQHYLNVLHTCSIHSHLDTDLDNSTFTKDAQKDVARAKPQGQRKSSSTANSDVILPKIVNR